MPAVNSCRWPEYGFVRDVIFASSAIGASSFTSSMKNAAAYLRKISSDGASAPKRPSGWM